MEFDGQQSTVNTREPHFESPNRIPQSNFGEASEIQSPNGICIFNGRRSVFSENLCETFSIRDDHLGK